MGYRACREIIKLLTFDLFLDTMKCTCCGNIVADDSVFCTFCGANIEEQRAAHADAPATEVCAACGAALSPDAMFCESCGHRVGTPVVTAQAVESPAQPQRIEVVATPEEDEQTVCSKCGAVLERGDGFCLTCGGRSAVRMVQNLMRHSFTAPSAAGEFMVPTGGMPSGLLSSLQPAIRIATAAKKLAKSDAQPQAPKYAQRQAPQYAQPAKKKSGGFGSFMKNLLLHILRTALYAGVTYGCYYVYRNWGTIVQWVKGLFAVMVVMLMPALARTLAVCSFLVMSVAAWGENVSYRNVSIDYTIPKSITITGCDTEIDREWIKYYRFKGTYKGGKDKHTFKVKANFNVPGVCLRNHVGGPSTTGEFWIDWGTYDADDWQVDQNTIWKNIESTKLYCEDDIVVSSRVKRIHLTLMCEDKGCTDRDVSSTEVRAEFDLENLDYDPDYVPDENEGSVNVTVDSNGGTSGDFPYSIPIGVIGAIGIGAAVYASMHGKSGEDGGDDDDEGEDEQASYDMYINKNFGDTLYIGEKPKPVYARIVKTTGNGSFTDMELTSMITISSPEGMDVTGYRMEGEYAAADVAAGAEAWGKGIVTFQLSGNGSSYTNNMHFYIANPDIVLDESELNVIAGDGNLYKFAFTVKTGAEPKDVRIDNVEGFSIRCERDGAAEDYRYVLTVENHSQPLTSIVVGTDKSTHPNRIEAVVEADVEDGKTLSQRFEIVLYPDGASVWTEEMEDDRMVIHTENEYEYMGEKGVVDTAIDIYHARYNAQTQRAEVQKVSNLSVDKELRGDKLYVKHLGEDFKYRITHIADSFHIAPKHTLAMKEEPYEVALSVTSTINGQEVTYEVPALIYGKKPEPIDEWKVEYEKLKRTIVNFNLQDDPNVLRTLRAGRAINAHDLNYFHRALLEEVVQFYEGEAERYETIDKWLAAGEVCCSALEFIGDQAFTFLAKRWTGELGECILSPLKKFTEKWLAEYTVHELWGESGVDVEDSFAENTYNNSATMYYEMATKILEKEVTDTINIFKEAGGWSKVAHRKKQVGIIVAGFALVNFVKHYNFDDDEQIRGSVFKSLQASLTDLTTQAIKTILGEWLGKYMDKIGNGAGNKVVTWFGSMIKENDGLQEFIKDTCVDLMKKPVDALSEKTADMATHPIATVITFKDTAEHVVRNYEDVYKKTKEGIELHFANASYYIQCKSYTDLGRFFFNIISYPFFGLFDNPKPIVNADRIYKKREG